jgi:hypothetical protein
LEQVRSESPKTQKMLIFKVMSAEGFPAVDSSTYELVVQNQFSGIISLKQFEKEKITM